MRLRDHAMAAVLGGGLSGPSRVLGLYRLCRVRGTDGRLDQMRLLARAPLAAWRECSAFVTRYGKELEREFGVSEAAQRRTLFWVKLRHGVRPDAGVALWAFTVRRPRKWDCYLTAPLVQVLFGELADRCAPEIRRTIIDKRTFAGWGRAHGLPVNPLLASFTAGALDDPSLRQAADPLPAEDLFVKSANHWGGIGAERWRSIGNRRWRDASGQEQDADGLLAAFALRSRDRPVVVERCLTPHASLAPLTAEAVSTVRCVTSAGRDGEPRLLRATIRMPVGRMIVDNMAAGGMIAAVDVDSGSLRNGIGWTTEKLLQRRPAHPDRGTIIDGFVLELWPEVRRVALAAQRAATPLPFVGWDVALTTDGPILIEANVRWAADLVTLPQEMPLGDTDFAETLLRRWS